MAWTIDTCLLIDILEDDPLFGEASSRLVDTLAGDGLVICPVTYAEMAPAFDGDRELQDRFLAGVGVDSRQPWLWEDTVRAHAAWHEHVSRRRAQKVGKRPLADLLIGSFALRFQGLMTRNAGDFRTAFPALELRSPA